MGDVCALSNSRRIETLDPAFEWESGAEAVGRREAVSRVTDRPMIPRPKNGAKRFRARCGR